MSISAEMIRTHVLERYNDYPKYKKEERCQTINRRNRNGKRITGDHCTVATRRAGNRTATVRRVISCMEFTRNVERLTANVLIVGTESDIEHSCPVALPHNPKKETPLIGEFLFTLLLLRGNFAASNSIQRV